MTTQKKNVGGRPKNYTIDQVRQAVTSLIGEGIAVGQVDARTVKARLCSSFDVSDGICTRSLEEPVRLVLDEYAENQRSVLVQALPAGVAPAVETILARMQQDVLLVVAEQNARCQTAADAKCEELRRDKLNANWRVSELETAGAEQAQRIADLESELSRERAEKSAIAKELEAVRSDLRRSEQEVGIVDRLFSELRDPAVHADIRKMLAEVAGDQGATATP